MHLSAESKVSDLRLAVLRYSLVALFLFLLAGFWQLQIVRSEYYATLAERNHIRTLPLIAPRGVIVDRDGARLVDNAPAFSIVLVREHVPAIRDSLDAIARGLNLERSWLEERLREFENAPPYQPIVLKGDATLADIAFVEAHRSELPELELLLMYRRRYPPDAFAAHLFGHVGEVSKHEIASRGYQLGDIVGKMGVERYYNRLLMGTNGQRRVIVDSLGREVEALSPKKPSPGRSIRLTLDSHVQRAAERALAGRKGALVALDPRSGDILAMVSQPIYDPTRFAVGMSHTGWSQITNDPQKPLLNRAIQAQLAPGSIFKVIVATAALEEGFFDRPFTVQCPGWANHYGRVFQCWRPEGHGRVSLHRALVESCDVFFYEVGKRLGIERLAHYARELGLGNPTGIDLPGEEAGLVPSPDWKQRVMKEPWYAGETISVAIGQGALTVTPLQLAHTLGGIASGGVFVRPRLLLDPTEGQFTRRVELKQETVAQLTDALWGVVNENGTGTSARLPQVEVAGKTGTAQLLSYDALRRAGKQSASKLKDNAWFVGLSPRRNPEIVVAVLVEQGEHGGVSAAPLARDVIKAYFEKKSASPRTYAEMRPIPPRPQEP